MKILIHLPHTLPAVRTPLVTRMVMLNEKTKNNTNDKNGCKNLR